MIYGVFSSYKVKNGDHFMTTVGFKTDCSGGKVKFQLKYREGSTDTLLKEWGDSCNDELKTIDFDLSSLKGKEVQFILVVLADGSYKNDKFVWVDPRISNVTD